jgi:sugar/nucleoside kinase (ribokinase family)
MNTPVILPDFFLDHFLVTGSLNDFIERLTEMANQGGGNMMGTSQFVRRGGNSANVASALHKLGLDPVLIVTTDSYGKQLLQSLTEPGLNLSHVHENGALSSTVSIEVEYEGRRVNLMVSDSGSAARFNFEELNERDLDEISKSGIVVLENLNHNSEGVGLARDLFSYVRSHSEAITFMDTGDPSGEPDKIAGLAKSVVGEGLVDILSVNENEAAWFAWALDSKNQNWRESVKNPDQWLDTAQYVSQETGVRVDLHTPFYSATIDRDEVITVPSFEIESKVLCGAGDAWNAGDIFGELSGIDTRERLLLANAVAALYVSQGTAEHPTREDVMGFLQDMPSQHKEAAKLLKLK